MQLLVLKFGLDQIYSFSDIAIFSLPFFLEIAYLRLFLVGFGGTIHQNDLTHRGNPKTSLRGNTSFEPYSLKIGSAVRPGRVPKKKELDRTGQSKKSHQVVNW